MKKEQEKTQIKIRYSETSSVFASQFLVNSTPEDITVGFSSGYMKDPGTNETSLPVHSRISMTLAGAKRLHEILGKVLADNGTVQGSAPIKNIPDTQKH